MLDNGFQWSTAKRSWGTNFELFGRRFREEDDAEVEEYVSTMNIGLGFGAFLGEQDCATYLRWYFEDCKAFFAAL